MQKTLGIFGLLVAVCVVTAFLNRQFLDPYNLANQIHIASIYGVISIGAAIVIIGGGIDLSIGAIIALVACLLPWLLVEHRWPAYAALGVILLLSAAIGLVHGVLIVYGQLQPFVVTLSGMLIYRGIARWFTGDNSLGFKDRFDDLGWLVGRIPWTQGFLGLKLPPTALILLAIGAAAIVALNQTVFGRHLQAVGRNEQAARYSGINTARVTILSYVISALTAGIGGVLFALESGFVQPDSFGQAYEFTAIAAAVLGGCSLRGGEGSILGVIFGAALLQLLANSLSLIGIPERSVSAVIGFVILCGVAIDEVIRRVAARRRKAA